jgi:Rod binding domain-containing protein
MTATSVSTGLITTGLGIGSPDAATNSPEKIREAASQFEALLISQVLKAAHEGDGEGEGWLGTGEDQTADSIMGLADDYFARALAARGGFGLARMVAAGLDHRVSSEPVNNSSPELSPEPETALRTDD